MTAIIILAAGSSSRMGSAKQNLIYGDATLLQLAIHAATNSVGQPVVVVLGANADAIVSTIDENCGVTIINNEQWEEGMCSSIRAGVKALKTERPEVTSIICILCDQPFVNADLINTIINANKDNASGLVACTYNDTIGTPALFGSAYFDELLSLTGPQGAKHILEKYRDKVIAIPFPLGAVDVDTDAEYQRLKNMTNNSVSSFRSFDAPSSLYHQGIT